MIHLHVLNLYNFIDAELMHVNPVSDVFIYLE